MYQGEWRTWERGVRGSWRYGAADAEVGGCCAGKLAGAGVLWSADRRRAWHLLDGEEQAEISLDTARELAAQIGLPVPPPHAG